MLRLAINSKFLKMVYYPGFSSHENNLQTGIAGANEDRNAFGPPKGILINS